MKRTKLILCVMYIHTYACMCMCMCVCGLYGIQKFHTRLRNCIKTYQITLKFSYSKSSSNVVAAAAAAVKSIRGQWRCQRGSDVVEGNTKKDIDLTVFCKYLYLVQNLHRITPSQVRL